MTSRCGAGVLTLVVAVATPALGQEPSAAGRIHVAVGSVFILRESGVIPAQTGQVVFEADGLRTGADGRIGVTLQDDTRVSLGPSSEVQLARYVYAPADGRLAFVLKIVRGVAAYVSGRIAKLSPDSIRLETPAASVGVRGTSLAISVEPSMSIMPGVPVAIRRAPRRPADDLHRSADGSLWAETDRRPVTSCGRHHRAASGRAGRFGGARRRLNNAGSTALEAREANTEAANEAPRPPSSRLLGTQKSMPRRYARLRLF